MNNAQKRTLRRIIIEAALLLLLLPLQARAAEYKCTAELPALPQTADPMPVTLLAVLAVLSAGGLMGLYYNKYGRKERK